MKPITLAGFAGSNFLLDAYLLPESVGVSASNCEPGRGDLRPLLAPLTVATVPTSPQRKTIWRMGRDVPNDANYWLGWSTPVNASLGFDGADTTERTYYTGDGTPKWTDNTRALSGGPPYPQAARELAVPRPTSAPTVTETTPGTGTESERFYGETFVNDLGWESAMSPVSTGLLVKPGAVLSLALTSTPPSGNYGFTARRIYRTQTDTTNTGEFFFLREVAIGTTTTTDDARGLGDAFSTEGWIPPPADAKGFIALWSEMYALGAGKTLNISATGAPYAYPIRYDIELFHSFVGTGKWQQNLVVLTTGNPVLVNGQDPESLSDEPLGKAYPCLAAQGIASMGDCVVWPSSEGLAYVGPKGQFLLTENTLDQHQWKALVPSSMVAGRYGRLYVCSYNDGSGRKGFIIDPNMPEAGITWLTTGFDACHYDELADALYVLEGGNVRKFDAGPAPLTAIFKSKVFKQTQPVNFAWCKVVAKEYPVQIKIWSERCDPLTQAITMVLRKDKSVPNGEAFTLPGGFLSEDWQIEVSSPFRVIAVRIASEAAHLKGI